VHELVLNKVKVIIIIRVIKSGEMRMVGYVTRTEEERRAHRVFVGKLNIRPSGDLSVDGRVIQSMMSGLNSSGS
jgi:hypothetical protein